MKTWAHGLAALPLASVCYFSQGSAPLAAAVAAASVLVDLDHLLDYLLWRRRWLGLGDFFDSFHSHQVPNLYLVAHAWELMALAWALILGLGAPAWARWLGLAWLYHLAWDQATNGVGPWFYFWVHRARMGFRRSVLRPPARGERA